MQKTGHSNSIEKIKFEEYTFTLSSHWLPALINGDITGLQDGESEDLDAWLKTIPENGHWSIPSEDDESSFMRDEISNLMSDAYKMSYMVPTKKDISASIKKREESPVCEEVVSSHTRGQR